VTAGLGTFIFRTTSLTKVIRNEALKQHHTAPPLPILLIIVTNESSKLPHSFQTFFALYSAFKKEPHCYRTNIT
jgi:hypothetical protein